MDIKEFKYAWRYTSENYALFSPKQLSEMNVVNENKAVEIWNSICDNEILEFIRKKYFRQSNIVI